MLADIVRLGIHYLKSVPVGCIPQASEDASNFVSYFLVVDYIFHLHIMVLGRAEVLG